MVKKSHARQFQRAEELAAWSWLCSAEAIRDRCSMIHAAAERGTLRHFTLDASRLAPTADFVLDTIRSNYPDLAIPYHSRWRHFSVGGRDRWAELASSIELSAAERARLRFELAIISVLTDAGAGSEWCYLDPQTGHHFARSEGLALAGFNLVAKGGLALDRHSPRVDVPSLCVMTSEQLADAFQVNAGNPLAGLEGRATLLRNLGCLLLERRAPRLGTFFDTLAQLAGGASLDASAILQELTSSFAAIWPSRLSLGDLPLGDVWQHPACTTHAGDPATGLVPFHKLSQWLAYSLVEPLEEAGIAVRNLDALTGLPEYRNGGLFIDCGVLEFRDEDARLRFHQASDELVVEWRALTVILLDRIADMIRERLGLDAAALPLARVLEGGTWSAGRRIARQRRPDGSPPLRIESDGTVF